jgi:hypothetical protein
MAQLAIEDFADRDPVFSALPQFHSAINGSNAPIYSRLESGKLQYLTDSCAGGGQGNPSTNSFFPMLIDSPLKSAMQRDPGIDIKALQDDITVCGKDLASVLDTVEHLIEELGKVALEPNRQKFQLYSNKPDELSDVPDWLTQPSVPQPGGASARGVIICGAAIGDDAYISTFLDSKQLSLCGSTSEDGTHIPGSLENLINPIAEACPHSAASVMFYSVQARVDYLLSTHLPSQTRNLAAGIDECIRNLYVKVNGADLLDPNGHADGLSDPSLVADRFKLASKYGGSGFRPTILRANYANSLNSNAALAMELFPHLETLFGKTSFDTINGDKRWTEFFTSGIPEALELESEFMKLQNTYLSACEDAALDPPPKCLLTQDIASFGSGDCVKLQKTAFDLIKPLKVKAIHLRIMLLSPEDPRSQSFLASTKDPFAHALLQSYPTRFTVLKGREYQVAIQNYLGVPLSFLLPLLGQPIANQANRTARKVDQYGRNIKCATGTKGFSATGLHNGFQSKVVESSKNAGISTKPGTDIFSHLVNANVPLGQDSQWLQGILPDIVVNGKDLPQSWTGPGMKLFGGCTTLTDVKTLAPGNCYAVSPTGAAGTPYGNVVATRAKRVDAEYHKHAEKLDGGTDGPIKREMDTYGQDGVVLGLVMGSYGEFSEDVHALADLIATKRAHDFCVIKNMSLKQAKSMFLQKLHREWGLYAHRGWANLVLLRSKNLHTAGGGQMEGGDSNEAEDEEDIHMEYNHVHPERGGTNHPSG